MVTILQDDYPTVEAANEYGGNHITLMNFDPTSGFRNTSLNKIKLDIYICGNSVVSRLIQGYGECSAQELGRLEAMIKRKIKGIGIVKMSDGEAFIISQAIPEGSGDWEVGMFQEIYYRRGGRAAIIMVYFDRKSSEMKGIVSSFSFLR